jgi:hypothetical protein
MAEPVRAPSAPAEPRGNRPRYRLPDDALTADELALLDKRDPVDGAKALAWLDGEGPDPWRDESS